MKLQRAWITGVVSIFLCAPALAQRGFGGGAAQRTKLVPQFDKDGDGRLNTSERAAARQYLAANPRGGRFRGGGFGGGRQDPGTPGPKLAPSDVRTFYSEPFYDMNVLRTLFFEFERADWEREMADFWHTDVEVPARLTVDGKVFQDVGVHFRGQTSFQSISEGRKRSLGVSMGYAHPEQRLYGYRTLNLLNAAGDPTFLRTALYQFVARQYIAAPKVNYVRVVINGESWGIYVNAEQIGSELTNEYYRSPKGARWKLPGSPGGRAGLAYLGDDPASYKFSYEIKTKDDPKAWANLINLCKVLNQTPPERLEAALKPLLDVDETLKFLAIDKALINNDGYWTRASDYGIYEDPSGRFHMIPWDANETLREIEQMGRFDGGGGSGVALDPFAGSSDPQKALLYRLLAVPALRQRYLGYLRDIAEKWLDWVKVGPMVQQWQAVIAADIRKDTRKIYSTESFVACLTRDDFEPGWGMVTPPSLSLKSFLERRRAYLLSYPGIGRPAQQ
jgi:hypothetical protein